MEKTNEWSLPKKQAFRFLGLYFFLYLCSNFLFRSIYDPIVEWLGVKLHVWKSITVYPNGSGDTTYNYLQVACILFIAFIGSLYGGPSIIKENTMTSFSIG